MLVWMESQTTRAIGQVLTLLHTISTASTTTTAESPYALSLTLTTLLARYTASTLTTPTTTTTPTTKTIAGTGTLKKEDPLKEAEDSILNNLKTLGKLLRGAAELLTDPTNTDTPTTTNMDVDSSEHNSAGNSTSNSSATIHLTTAREALQKLLAPETRKYASEIRLIVLEFLIFIHERLSALSPTTLATATSATTSSSGEVASVYASLGNNALVRGAWVKLLSICITRRQACKDTI